MFNVFVPFHIKMIEGFRKMNRRFLVAQTNLHAIDHLSEGAKDPILLTDYDNIIAAKTHLNAIIGKDKYKYILDLENAAHRKKVEEMLSPDSKYKVYAAFIDDLDKVKRRLNEKYSSNIRNYISRKTTWRINRDETIYPNLELEFGELYVTMKYASQTERIKLSDLEKY